MSRPPIVFDDLLADFRAALWLGELLIATGRDLDLSSPELDQIATVFFSLFPPATQA